MIIGGSSNSGRIIGGSTVVAVCRKLTKKVCSERYFSCVGLCQGPGYQTFRVRRPKANSIQSHKLASTNSQKDLDHRIYFLNRAV